MKQYHNCTPIHNAKVVILHMGLANFGTFVITVKEISLSLIFSDGTEPAIDDVDRIKALTAYNSLSDTAKEIWRVSSFLLLLPSLQKVFHTPSIHLSNNTIKLSHHRGGIFPV